MMRGAFMRREIFEQPQVIARLLDEEGPKIRTLARRWQAKPPRLVVLAARGSSDNAALYGRYLIEILLGVPVSLAAPSVRTLYKARLRLDGALAIALSQSGRSPDIVEFMRGAARAGAHTIAVTNDPHAPLARAADDVLLLHAGPERSVAATKTYTAQLTALSLLGAMAARRRLLVDAHQALPDLMARALGLDDNVRQVAARYRKITGCITVSRGYNFATALEAALKLRETCSIGAEALSSADLLHGPIASIGRGFPVLLIAAQGRALPHLIEIMRRLRRRGARVLGISSSSRALKLATSALAAPEAPDETLSPHVLAVPLQLLAYHLALLRGFDPDRPRGLRKVTRVL